MSTPAKARPWKFVESSTVVSKAGSKIVVKELTLTERGRQAITSGIREIRQGALEDFGPEAPHTARTPAPA